NTHIDNVHERVLPGESMPSGEAKASLAVTHEQVISDPHGIYTKAAAWADQFAKLHDGYAGIQKVSETECYLVFYDSAQVEADYPMATEKGLNQLLISSSDPTGDALLKAIEQMVPQDPMTREGHGPDVPVSFSIYDCSKKEPT